MVQLNILSGSQAGTEWVVSSFPITIGRANDADLRVEEPGVFDYHLIMEWQQPGGFLVRTHGEALASINDIPQTNSWLRNGDVIDFGGARIQFFLAEAKQKSQKARELGTWIVLSLLILFEIYLVYTIG